MIEKMKSLVFLYAGWDYTHAFDSVFSSQSAFERCLVWVRECFPDSSLVVLASSSKEKDIRPLLNASEKKYSLVAKDFWNTQILLSTMDSLTKENSATNAVLAFADCPFLDTSLTKEVLECHEKYIAEYTFADGYPHGFAPEVIDAGSLSLLAKISSEKESGKNSVSKDSLFSVMKADLNSFEIESVVSEKDYRMLRLDFSCTNKANTLACKRLYELALDNKISFDAKSLSDFAFSSGKVQCTLPAFYNVQIAQKISLSSVYNPYPALFKKNPLPQDMPLEPFRALMSDISSFSETAVVSLSAFGEPLTVPRLEEYVSSVLTHSGLSVLIETDASLLTKELAEKISSVCEKFPERLDKAPKITWIVSVDAATEATYAKLHPNALLSSSGESSFKKAVDSISLLSALFPNNVYPQFLRMNANEDELETFYRFWHDKNSPSKGKLIIQKYDYFCGLLPQEKPADLSPLNRMPCWHLKRDMTILSNGDVLPCRERINDAPLGNVFDEGVSVIQEKISGMSCDQVAGKTDQVCRACDEYYTFNF